jgi:hypothetical protein
MTITIEIPEDLYQQAVAIAEASHMRVDEVFAAALSEQLTAWKRLRERAARGDREKYLAVLADVPDVEPEPADRI